MEEEVRKNKMFSEYIYFDRNLYSFMILRDRMQDVAKKEKKEKNNILKSHDFGKIKWVKPERNIYI